MSSGAPQRPTSHRLVHHGPSRAAGPRCDGPGPPVLPLRNNSESNKSNEFYTESPKLARNCAVVPVHLENLQQGPPVSKNNYEYVLNHSKPLKIPQKMLENPQISQEPLSFAPRTSNHSKKSRIPQHLLKRPFCP
jgi:hypothetical protein